MSGTVLLFFVFRIVEDNPIFILIESKAPEQQNVSMATRNAVSAPTTPVSSTVKFVTEKPPVPSELGLSIYVHLYMWVLPWQGRLRGGFSPIWNM